MTTYCPRCGEDTYHTHQQAEDADYAFIEGAVLSAAGANDELARNLQTRLGRIQSTLYQRERTIHALERLVRQSEDLPEAGDTVQVRGGTKGEWGSCIVSGVDVIENRLVVRHPQGYQQPVTLFVDGGEAEWRWPDDTATLLAAEGGEQEEDSCSS